ncbi:MAG: formate dehydrogenase subunit alpha, partial [Clostridia bacterium]|nr:formate dehydrogenase subunit alpha [Clostridia bacterium]
TMSRRVAGLEALLPAEWLEVNPEDLAALGLTDGEEARLSSRRGSLVVRVRASTAVPPGLVFTSFHFRELAINQLTNPARDPQAKIPELKVCAVRLEKL